MFTLRMQTVSGLGLSRSMSSRPHSAVDRIIRVDHAGEFGADKIYAGQAAVLGKSEVGPLIQVCYNLCLLLIRLCEVAYISGSMYSYYTAASAICQSWRAVRPECSGVILCPYGMS